MIGPDTAEQKGLDRRNLLSVGAATLLGAVASRRAEAQDLTKTREAERGPSATELLELLFGGSLQDAGGRLVTA